MTPGQLPDPEDRLVRRERAARRWAGATAVAAVVVGGVAWLAGPCLYLLVRPYVWRGAGWLAAWSAVFGLAGLALIAGGREVRRAVRAEPGRVPAALARLAWRTGVLAVPLLLWGTCAALMLATTDSRPRFRWRNVDVLAIVGAPVVPLALALLTLARFRRQFHGMPAVADGAPVRRARVSPWWAVLTVPLLAAWWWPGGPRVTRTGPSVEGESLDDWARQFVAGDTSKGEWLVAAGAAAIPAITAQWPLDTRGLRPRAADWLQARLGAASSMASPYAAIGVGGAPSSEVVGLLATVAGDSDAVVDNFVRWGLEGDELVAWQIADILAGMGRPGARALAALTAREGSTVRLRCLRMLGALREPHHEPLGDAELEPVAALLGHPWSELRHAAVQAYGAWSRPQRIGVIVPALREMLADRDRVATVAAIATRAGPACGVLGADLVRAAEAMLARRDRADFPAVLRACVAVCADDPACVQLLTRTLGDPSHDTHRAALFALRASSPSDERHLATLRRFAADPVPRCRAAAFTVLVAIHGADDEVCALLEAEWQAGVVPGAPAIWRGYSEMLDGLVEHAASTAGALPTLARHCAAAPIYVQGELVQAICAIQGAIGGRVDPFRRR